MGQFYVWQRDKRRMDIVELPAPTGYFIETPKGDILHSFDYEEGVETAMARMRDCPPGSRLTRSDGIVLAVRLRAV